MDKPKLFSKVKRLRFLVMYPFAVLIVFLANPSDQVFRLGARFIIIGLLVRLWANGYAIKLDRLTTSGPYAFIRHPLYFGTMFISVGVAIMMGNSLFTALFVFSLILVYAVTIKKEERMLEDKFGQEYRLYQQKVPAMIPRLVPYNSSEKWSYSFRRLVVDNKEYKLVFWIAILLVIFYIKGEVLLEHETLNPKGWTLIVVAGLLIVSDVLIDFSRWMKRQGLSLKLV